MNGLRTMVRRQLRVNRTSLLVVAGLITVYDIVQVRAYQSVFPDPATRDLLLAGFTSNGALRALYGYPYDVGIPTGWLAWRSLGFLVVVMAVWGAFITVGALRGEEEAGRAELGLSQPQSRRAWLTAALVTVTLEALAVGAVNLVGLAAFCVPQGLMTVTNCVEISLQLVVPALLFAAVGAVASQLIGTTRGARIAAAAVVVVAFFLRAAADAGSGIAWLRWATPLGWVEELHPPGAPSITALAVIGAACLALGLLALPMLAVRDVGLGLFPGRDRRRPRRFLLGAPWQAALRDDLPQLSMWAVGAVLSMVLMGSLTRTLLDLVRSNSAFGTVLGNGFGVTAFITAIFALVQVIVTLLAVTMVVGARGEEASGRLELLVAAPLSRVGWLLGRVALAGAAALALSLLAAVALWTGTVTTGQPAALGPIVEAALDCVPLIVIGVGAAVALLALAPRAMPFIYAPVAVAFLWDALGTALKAPIWSLDLSPFHALAQMPAHDFALLPAAVLTVIGLAMLALGASVFRRRDLVTA